MQTLTQTQTNRFERPVNNRLIGGVAAGIADYFSISTLAVRVGFIALTLIGAGIPLYAIGWILLPSSDASQSPAERLLARADSRSKQVAAIVIGFLLLAAVVGYSPVILLMAAVLGIVSYQLLKN